MCKPKYSGPSIFKALVDNKVSLSSKLKFDTLLVPAIVCVERAGDKHALFDCHWTSIDVQVQF